MRVSVCEVTVRFGTTTALDQISFEVEPGAVFALVGRNGAGKSTAIRALLGALRPNSGTITIDGADPWRERERLLGRIGATPETPDAPTNLTLSAIAASMAPLYATWDTDDFAQRLARFELDPRRQLGVLSRGQKSLAMLSLALASRPALLVLDDPTLGVDAVSRRLFFEELIVELADRGATVLIASHDLEGVERVATDVGILRDGQLVASGSLDDLRSRAIQGQTSGPSLEEIVVAATTTREGR